MVIIPVGFSFAFKDPTKEKAGTGKEDEQRKSRGEVANEDEVALVAALFSREMVIYYFTQLTLLGVFATYMYQKDRLVIYFGLSEEDANAIFAILGLSNSVGRLLFGILVDLFRRRALFILTAASLANALSVLVSPYLPSFAGQVVFTLVFGATFGALASCCLLTLVLISRDRVTERLGVSELLTAVTAEVGPLMVGAVVDSYGQTSALAWRFAEYKLYQCNIVSIFVN